MMPETGERMIGAVGAQDSARFVSSVQVTREPRYQTGEPEYWLRVYSYRSFEDAKLDRAGWLALRDLCDRVVAAMDEEQDA